MYYVIFFFIVYQIYIDYTHLVIRVISLHKPHEICKYVIFVFIYLFIYLFFFINLFVTWCYFSLFHVLFLPFGVFSSFQCFVLFFIDAGLDYFYTLHFLLPLCVFLHSLSFPVYTFTCSGLLSVVSFLPTSTCCCCSLTVFSFFSFSDLPRSSFVPSSQSHTVVAHSFSSLFLSWPP